MIAAGVASAGLAVGSWWVYRKRNMLLVPDSLVAGEGESIFNAWLKIATDGRIIVQVPRQEMGQGISTALPMLVAEELGCDFNDIDFEQAPIASVYGNAVVVGESVPYRPDDESWIAEFTRLTQFKMGRVLGLQLTAGSSSVRDAWEPMRHAGATARAMLVTAAARRLQVPEGECTVHQSQVVHKKSDRGVSFGSLATEAAALPMPEVVTLKDRSEFEILGTDQPRLDIPAKVDGSAAFGIDARPDGMVYAAIKHSPVIGGGISAVDSANAGEMPGVRAVLELPTSDTTQAAVVVVADHYWQAKKALDAVNIEWHDGANAAHDSTAQKARYKALLKSEGGRTYDAAGDVAAAFEDSTALVIEQQYFAPYLSHAAMEPMNCTAVIRADDSAEVWVGNQMPPAVRGVFAKGSGIDPAKIVVHTPYIGGGFGRRAEMDVVMEAAQIAIQMRGTPVQLIWSREEDIQQGQYRPMGGATMRAAISDTGDFQGLDSKVIGQSCSYSLISRLAPGMESNVMKDRTSAEGIFDLSYAVPNRRVRHVLAEEPIPVTFWRSVGYSQNSFFAEAFIDECAEAANKDPYAFRYELLSHTPRHQNVLKTVATKANWDKAVPDGIGRGIALVEAYGSVVAQIAEVEIVDGEVQVRRVVCAVDCGFAINPDTVKAQIESSIIYGLTAALFGEITIKDGRVQQSNFPDYAMVTLAQSPDIDVHIIESGVEHLGGIGEPGTPPIAPAVANAVYTLTGKRVRELPIRV